MATKAGDKWAGPERPEILAGLAGWYDDFWELSTDRQIGMTIGPIPAASIERHTADWPDDDAEMFRVCMRRMDSVYLNYKPGKTPVLPPKDNLSPQDKITALFGGRIT